MHSKYTKQSRIFDGATSLEGDETQSTASSSMQATVRADFFSGNHLERSNAPVPLTDAPAEALASHRILFVCFKLLYFTNFRSTSPWKLCFAQAPKAKGKAKAKAKAKAAAVCDHKDCCCYLYFDPAM